MTRLQICIIKYIELTSENISEPKKIQLHACSWRSSNYRLCCMQWTKLMNLSIDVSIMLKDWFGI